MGSRKFLLKQREVAEASLLGEIRSSVFRPATVSIDIVEKSSLSCSYGLNSKKHILRINCGRSDRSVPTITSNCTDNNTRSFTISCQAAVYVALILSW